MLRNMCCAMALALAIVPAYAQDSELSKLREALRQLQEQVQQLEKRLQDAENTATQAAAQAASRPQTESALNPGISAILNGVYSNLKQNPNPQSAALPNGFRINGFVPTLGDVGPGRRGLNLGESELGFSANIDHQFRGTLIA